MRAVVREDDGHGDRVRALRSHVDVACPAIVVGIAIKRQNCIIRACDAITAVVVAPFAISRVNAGDTGGGAVCTGVEV